MPGFLVGNGVCDKRLSPKAILVTIHDPSEEMMEHIEAGDTLVIPSSQVHDLSEVYDEDHTGSLIVTEWFAAKKEWAE